jgi:uncharacterized protein YxjI
MSPNTLLPPRMRQCGAEEQTPMSNSHWPHTYIAERPFFNLFGRTFKILSDGELVFYVQQKLFKLKEAINVYSDATKSHSRLEIQARNVIDFSATYDVTDTETHECVGSLSRKGLRSMFRDTWLIHNTDGTEIGKIEEDSGFLAIIRRMFLKIIPQTFHVSVGDTRVGTIRQHFNLFKLVYEVNIQRDSLDPRLGIAASVLLLAIEGRQN